MARGARSNSPRSSRRTKSACELVGSRAVGHPSARQQRVRGANRVGNGPVAIAVAEHQLAWGHAPDLFEQAFDRRRFGGPEIAGGDVEEGQPVAASPVSRRGGHEARGPRVERLFIENHARGHHPNDVALDDPLHRPGILELLAQGHPVSELGQLGQVAAGGVVRNPAHRDGVFLPLVARRERQVEDAGHVDRVFIEHLVEVAEAEEQDGVRIPRLDLEVLAHERRGRARAELGLAEPAKVVAGWGGRSRRGRVRKPSQGSRWIAFALLQGGPGRAPAPYFFAAGAFFAFAAGFAPAAALVPRLVRRFVRRALSFRCAARRRIFIDFRLSRLPMGSQ